MLLGVSTHSFRKLSFVKAIFHECCLLLCPSYIGRVIFIMNFNFVGSFFWVSLTDLTYKHFSSATNQEIYSEQLFVCYLLMGPKLLIANVLKIENG